MILFLLYHSVSGQERNGFETYYYPGSGSFNAISAKLFHQDHRGWCTELRYNYELEQTIACSAGKTFAREGAFSYSLTPMTGVIAGRRQGGLVGSNISATYKKMTFSSSAQFATCFGNEGKHFLFSWSEIGCQLTSHFYTGLVFQQTCFTPAMDSRQFGLEGSVSFGGWTIPIYWFKTPNMHFYWATGMCYEWKKHP